MSGYSNQVMQGILMTCFSHFEPIDSCYIVPVDAFCPTPKLEHNTLFAHIWAPTLRPMLTEDRHTSNRKWPLPFLWSLVPEYQAAIGAVSL